jgi:hypothetical protein
MSLTPANVGRILAGVVLLFGAWGLGGYVGETICPGTILVGGRESLAGKIGCSVGVLAAAVIARRYLLRSFGLALTCLGVTETVVLLIILGFSGLTSFSMADIRFNGWWLYALTWNVVVVFVLGQDGTYSSVGTNFIVSLSGGAAGAPFRPLFQQSLQPAHFAGPLEHLLLAMSLGRISQFLTCKRITRPTFW